MGLFDFLKPPQNGEDKIVEQETINPLHIGNEEEYQQLKHMLAQGRSLDDRDLERLAFTLDEWCSIHCVEDEDLDNATQELDLLFACFTMLPSSETIREMLCSSSLIYIDQAGNIDNFAPALDCIARLQKLQATRPTASIFTRTCANAMVLTIINYLDSEESFINEAQALYCELEALVRANADDNLVLPAMLAWAKRNFLWNSAREYDKEEMQRGLADLTALLEADPDNALLAGEYACACYLCFREYLSHSDLDKAYNEMLPELERMVRVYGKLYRTCHELLPDYSFPAYSPDFLDDYLTSALSDIAARDTEENNLQGVLECQARLAKIPYPPQATLYLELRRQILSNLALLYGRIREYAKATQSIKELRELITDDEGISSLADALYNLITDCASDNPRAYNKQIQFFLGELAELAHRTDGKHEHTRYVMALYNLSCQLENADIPHMSIWDRVYSYTMEHDAVSNFMVEKVAEDETSLIASAHDLDEARKHWERVKALYEHPVYSWNENMAQWLAVADYNLLVMADRADHLSLADDLLQDLMRIADKHSGQKNIHREILLRVAKGAFNLVTEYGNRGAIPHAEEIYAVTAPLLLQYTEDEEMAALLLKAAVNLCIDLKNSGQHRKISDIYGQIKGIKTVAAETAGYLKKIRDMI